MSELYAFGFFLFGCIFGSFANVLILRLPEDESIVPRSHCNSCKKQIPWKYNIPVISWIWLRGKCRECGAPFSIQYLIVEVLMGLLFAAAWWQWGASWYTLELLIFIFGAVTASFIDIKHYILPDVFTLGGLAIAFVGAALNPERGFYDALFGFLLGGGILYAVAYIYYALRKQEGMGGGDIKLLAWIGALMGWQSILFVIFVSCFAGSLFSAFRLVVMKKGIKEPIPFGPFIVFAALTYVLGGAPTIVQGLGYLMGLN